MPFILALLIGLAFRLLFISHAPGLHFDEAWAANYASKIASEPGFWPIDAMSPYTHPWSHYITAFFFKLFGTHLWVSRLAGIVMSGVGILLISKSLSFLGEKKAAAYFACLAAVSVPSVLNERFAIEINTFHVLCLGLLAYGLVTSRWLWIAVATVFGVTSHILFLAPALAAFLVWAARGRNPAANPTLRRDRISIAIICLILLPFFWSVYAGIPEKGKALALMAIDLGILFYVAYPFSLERIERRLRWVLLPVVAFFLVLVCAMMEGDLSIAFTYGAIRSHWVSILCIVGTIAASGYLFGFAWKQISRGQWPGHFAQWAFYAVFLVGVMSTKPAPRYFEMVFLMALAGAAITLTRLPSRKSTGIFIGFYVLINGLQWCENYIGPALRHEGVDRSFRYLLFHDNSSDSLSKQNLVAELGSEGCAPEQVITSDPRLAEALKFLAIGDWKIDSEKKCPTQKVKVERAATGAVGRRFEEFTVQPVATLPEN